ncbi:DUF4189 domain-containing protein [Streptomyces sp. NBC_01808]|uniref:DUF4189 domain-containing protein n=1 Tax=Streptomyces sp. NBC_01808 TaxID=2975947 RepID=UPI002DDB71C7|nr:DUF4189 domain-containing protein [Streptomyces sp. NBC_01808]WSA40190.1 DUF4189 domain-containing protein [Streptomyces sp. NBC_01808]
MTSRRPSVVDHRTLALGRRLGQGGQGTVHQVTNKKVNTSQGDGWDAVYKEYAPAVLPQLDVTALEALVGLTAAQGRWLCERTAWPAAVVRQQGITCGFLMRAVPDRFMFTLQRLQGSTGTSRRLANMEYLLNDDAYVAGIGLVISERDRLLLLADLADTLDRLHALGIVIGDLSPKNLLFATGPRPGCFLIDCDAVRLHGATALPQAETPDWEIPAGEEKATRAGDAYKFALLAVRLLARDQTSTDPAALSSLSPELGRLARAGLDRDPAARPAPGQWAAPLTSASGSASTRPAAGGARRGHSRGGSAGSPRPPGAPGAPTGPRPPANTPPNKGAGVAAAVVVALLALFAVEAAQDDTGSAAGTSVGDVPTTPSWRTPSTYDPPDPDPPDYHSPEDEPDPPDPTPTRTSRRPAAPPPPPPPPPKNYGAIAVNRSGGYARSWDYDSSAEARAAALKRCNRSDCKVLTTFVNGCGAVAYNSSTRRYHGGSGDSPGEATRDAIARAGGGRWITYVCTTR